jgi:phosphate transport system permease protein
MLLLGAIVMKGSREWSEWIAVLLLGSTCCIALGVMFFILFFILVKGIPSLSFAFLTGAIEDMGRSGGIFPSIAGTAFITALAILFATPLGVGSAIYLTEYTRTGPMARAIRFGVECLAGVPSILFGLFGFVFFVLFLKLRWSILSGSLTLALMMLPTIIRTSEEAIRTVPASYRDVSASLGAGKWQTVVRAVLPSALPGIMTGVILSVGRCVGETAAVIFTAGSSILFPKSIFTSTRTLSVHFYLLAREGLSIENAYGTAAVLIIAILLINLAAYGFLYSFVSRRRL